MKKVISVILSAVIILSAVSLCVFGAEDKTPVIILQGYSGPTLINTDTGEQVWGLDFDKVGERVKEEIPNLLANAADEDALVQIIGTVLLEQLEPIACNPDGTSKYNVECYPQGAENNRLSVLRANGGKYIPEKELVDIIANKIGEENVFIFVCDWRKGQADYADEIDKFIQEVKNITGSEKVDLFGLSHGGQCGASYLYYYGYKQDVRKAMLTSPAIGGTSIVGELFTGNSVDIDYATIVKFVEQGTKTEENFEQLIGIIGVDRLNPLLNRVLQEYAIDFVKYFPSLWDFVPLDYFEDALKYTKLDPIESAPLIAKTTAHHTAAMAHMSEGLKRAQKAGTQIGIISCTGAESFTGNGNNSDYIIDVYTSSGAKCADIGETFEKDYTPARSSCSNENHYHISPDFDIDASCAYLPDTTWFVKGQYHGMYVFDAYTRGLVTEFFYGNVKDVFSDSRYPQFEASQNTADGLYVRFDSTSFGYHTQNDKKLIIKNLSANSDAIIWSITVDGADFSVTYDRAQSIARGQVTEFDIAKGDFDSYSLPFTVTVKYSLKNNQLTYITQSVNFTPLLSEQSNKFNYLTKPAAVLPDIYEEISTDPAEAEKTTDKDEPTDTATTTTATEMSADKTTAVAELSTDKATTESAESNTDFGKIPNTSRVSGKASVIAGTVILLSGAFTVSITVFRKRKISE